jgi:hypothetical protein
MVAPITGRSSAGPRGRTRYRYGAKANVVGAVARVGKRKTETGAGITLVAWIRTRTVAWRNDRAGVKHRAQGHGCSRLK